MNWITSNKRCPTAQRRNHNYFSTNAFKLCSAWSHCVAMTVRYAWADNNGLASSSYKLCRPALLLATRPTSSSTARCLVTACRVTLVPAVSVAIDCGLPSSSMATSAKRVGSPSAAKTLAYCFALRLAVSLRFNKESLNVFQLCFPPASVHLKRFGSAVQRNLIES